MRDLICKYVCNEGRKSDKRDLCRPKTSFEKFRIEKKRNMLLKSFRIEKCRIE